MIKEKEKSKEEFCGVCTAIPLAFAGTGTATLSKDNKENKRVKTLHIVSIVLTILSILYVIYYMCISKCNTCKF